MPFHRLLVGVMAVALVVLAFHTGLGLVTRGIPAGSFAGGSSPRTGLG